MKVITGLCFAAVLTAAGALAQEPPQPPLGPPPTTVIRTETRLVLVDAVVTDKKGAYVHDLEQKDFKVYDDNKEQAIKSFSFEADPAGPNKDQKRYLVLFFDDSNMGLPDQQRARDAAAKFIDANAGPNHLIAIAEFTGTLHVAQNFTEDADRLHQVVKDTKLSSGPAISGPGAGGLGRMGYEYGVRTSLLGLRALAKNLAGVSGRKSLVFFTSGFNLDYETQSELTVTISECNRANVAVYPVDVRGLSTTDPMGAPLGVPGGRGRGPGQALLSYPSPRLYGGARIFTAAFMPDPDPQRGPAGGGSTGGSSSSGGGTPGASAGGGGGRPAGGGTPGGGNTGGGNYGGAPTRGAGNSPSSGRNPAGNTGNAGGARGGGGSPNTMIPGQAYRNNPFYNSRNLLGNIPPFANDTQGPLYMLAEGTGGFVILNTNDLLGGLQKIGKEQNEYYLLGYSPAETPEGSCHALKVKVDKGFQVRARSGYCNVKQADLLSGKPIEKNLETRAEASEPGTIKAPLEAPYFFTGPNTARVDVAMEIPSDSVRFTKVKGKHHAEINILGIAYKEDGQVGARFSDTVNLDFEDKKQVEEFAQHPMHYDNQFDVASGKYNLKVVFNSGGADFGKLEKSLNIDPYAANQFALSDVALSKELHRVSAADAGLDALLLEGRTPLIASGMQITPSGTDHFRKTDTLVCYMEIYEPGNLGEKVPQIGIRMRILDTSGAAKVDSGTVEMTKESKQGNPVVPIGLRIPVAELAPGSYKAEIMAGDGAGKSAVRTVDFSVMQ
jgi:VWFA-related protein